METLKARLSRGETVYGPFLKTDAAALIEIIGQVGFDFVIVDMEHATYSYAMVERLVRVASLAGLATTVRVAENSENAISHVLDAGAESLLVPHVSTAAESQAVVKAAKFAPPGERGMDIYARSAAYGAIPKDRYFAQANEETLVAVQIEGQEGLSNLEEIIAVEGLDVIFVGPYDLSQSLGITGQVDNPRLFEHGKEIVSKAEGAGLAGGIYVDNAAAAHAWTEVGMRYISISVDVVMFRRGCQAVMDELSKGDR